MAIEKTLVRIRHTGRAVDLGLGQKPTHEPGEGIDNLAAFLEAVAGGLRDAMVEVAGNAVAATGTLTAGTADGNVTINGVVIAYTGASANARAADIASKVNASADPLVNQHVTATVVNAVVTLTAKTPGASGNAVTIAITGTGSSASGARLTGGTETMRSYNKGM